MQKIKALQNRLSLNIKGFNSQVLNDNDKGKLYWEPLQHSSKFWSRLFSVLLILFSFLGIISCSTAPPKEPEAKELVAASSKATDTPEQDLLSEAQRHFASGLFSVARESFERLRDSYPSGTYREFAEIKIADCYFESGSYEDASRMYEEFYRNHPASSSVTYAIFKAARSHQLSFKGVGRDPSPLERSLEIYNNLLTNYPETSLTAAAKGFRSEVQGLLAEGEKSISDFYSSAGNEDAAEVRMRQFERKSRELVKQQSKEKKGEDTVRDETNDRRETGLSAPQVVSAKVADKGEISRNKIQEGSASPGGNTPELSGSSTSSNKTAPQLSTSGDPLDVKVDSRSSEPGDDDLTPAALKITRLECKESGELSVVFYLSRPIPNSEAINQNFSAKSRILTIQLPVEEAVPAVRTCFGERDLTLSESGEVVMRGPSGADLFALNQPPRLVLVLRYPPKRPKFAR